MTDEYQKVLGWVDSPVDLPDLDIHRRMISTIRRALKIASAMTKEPTQTVMEAGFYANEKQYSGDPLDDMVQRTIQTHKAMIAQILKEIEDGQK